MNQLHNLFRPIYI